MLDFSTGEGVVAHAYILLAFVAAGADTITIVGWLGSDFREWKASTLVKKYLDGLDGRAVGDRAVGGLGVLAGGLVEGELEALAPLDELANLLEAAELVAQLLHHRKRLLVVRPHAPHALLLAPLRCLSRENPGSGRAQGWNKWISSHGFSQEGISV